MPWRAFGDSEPGLYLPEGWSGTGFNALAGVRGFGAGRPCGRIWGRVGFNALAGVRGFGDIDNWQEQVDGMEFQCPGGRSGIRSENWSGTALDILGFNALAGVRGFGGKKRPRHLGHWW